MTLGLVCDRCDALNALNAQACTSCGSSLGIVPSSKKTSGQHPQPAAEAAPAAATACPSCGTMVAPDFRFCPSCGKPREASAPVAADGGVVGGQAPGKKPPKTMFFSAMQAPRPKLILIKGEGMDGVSYMLSGTDHVAGRLEGAILFPEDPLLSPRHANFVYRDNKLFVRDEGSANGVFVRIMRPQQLQPGALFLVGEQLLRVEAVKDEAVPAPDQDGTYFYGSPKRPSKLQLVQMLAGGYPGMVWRAREDQLTIGREGNDVNFPDDPFISGRHATVAAVESREGPKFQLTDLGSKNGTFIRVPDETPLHHGDYVFIGQQLLRVEIT
jgi:pSer/pThr/pTyr-binding forkhead associated (FHA) protein